VSKLLKELEFQIKPLFISWQTKASENENILFMPEDMKNHLYSKRSLKP
jgi:hypothetical protein